MEPGKAIVASGASLKSTLHKRKRVRLDSVSKKNHTLSPEYKTILLGMTDNTVSNFF